MKILVTHRQAAVWPRRVASAPGGARLAAALKRSARTVLLWSERYGQRRRLRLLEPPELADIGLSADDVMQETRKYFWQR